MIFKTLLMLLVNTSEMSPYSVNSWTKGWRRVYYKEQQQESGGVTDQRLLPKWKSPRSLSVWHRGLCDRVQATGLQFQLWLADSGNQSQGRTLLLSSCALWREGHKQESWSSKGGTWVPGRFAHQEWKPVLYVVTVSRERMYALACRTAFGTWCFSRKTQQEMSRQQWR